MRSILCIVILCASSVFALGQSTESDTGLSDTLTPTHLPIPIHGKDAGDDFCSWSTNIDVKSNNDDKDYNKMVPNDIITQFGHLNSKVKTLQKSNLKKTNLYVFHIIDWSEAEITTNNYQIEFESSEWYVYRYTGEQFENIARGRNSLPQIYGMTNVVLISVSRLRTDRSTDAPSIQYSANHPERTASNIAALKALGSAVSSVKFVEPLTLEAQAQLAACSESPSYNYSVQAFVVSPKDLHAPFDATFTATATPAAKEGQAVVQDSHTTQGDASNKGQNTQGNAPASTSAPAKASDCSPLTDSGKCYFSRTFTVDSRQYWNVGVNIIVRGPRENKYALSSSNVVTQTHTIHAPLIAAFDVSPWAYWLPMDKYPYLQIGVPLSGSAFHMPYFGLAQPLPFTKKWLPISAYGGIVLMKQTFPKTIGVGQTTTTAAFNSDLETDWPIKAVFGIEVPVSSISNKVKSSVGAGK
jgi:hypothetical protein